MGSRPERHPGLVEAVLRRGNRGRRLRLSAVGRSVAFALLAWISVFCPAAEASGPVLQEASKLVSTTGSLQSQFGQHVALSADGKTAIVGAPEDSGDRGAAWVFVKTEEGWVQQGGALQPNDATGSSLIGYSLGLSANGDVAVVGGVGDNASHGAAWVFTRSHGTWAQQGAKLQPSDADPESLELLFGVSAAVSGDGNTVLVGATGDRPGAYGAAWVFVRSGGSWVQQGPKLLAPGEVLGADGFYSWFGSSVALSGDGDTALIGAEHDNEEAGSAWVFTRSGSVWSQDSELTSSGATGRQAFGDSVSLSADGQTAIVGAASTSGGKGGAWSFVRTGEAWSAPVKLNAPIPGEAGQFGSSVAIDPTGSFAVVGEPLAGGLRSGRAWLYTRSGSGWSASPSSVGPELEGFPAFYGWAVALSEGARVMLVGVPGSLEQTGAAWLFEAEPLGRLYTGMSSYAAAGPPPGLSVEAQAQFFSKPPPTGTVTFRWYGPDASGCEGSPVGVMTVPIAQEVFGAAASADLPVPALGKYIVVASYGGDGATGASADGCGEVVADVKSQPTIDLSVGSPRVGSATRIAASLVGGTAPSGTMILRVYGVGDPNCSGAPAASHELTVSDGTAPAVEYTPSTPGKLYVEVDYSGDANNFEAHHACGKGSPAVIGLAEPSAAISVPARVLVGDPVSAVGTLAGGFQPSGSLGFSLFAPADQSCSGNPSAVAEGALEGDRTVSGQFATSTTGTYHFQVRYDGDVDNLGAGSSCAAGGIDVVKRSPTASLASSVGVAGYGSLESRATLRDSFAASGTVTFSLYRENRHCRGEPLARVLAAVGASGASTGVLGVLGAGRYEMVARYSGDVDNEAAGSRCGAAQITVPSLLVGASASRGGVRVGLRCVGVQGRVCGGSISIVASGTGRRVARVGYSIRRGKVVQREVRVNALGMRLLRAQRWSMLAVVLRLDDEHGETVVQRRRVMPPVRR
jgi:hypothetical protein